MLGAIVNGIKNAASTLMGGGPADASAEKPEQPKRPPIPPRVRARVQQIWADTNNVPEFQKAASAYEECQKVLMPAWFDRTDAYRGNAPQELLTREINRKVRVPLVFKNVLQTVAMLVPEDHSYEWEPIPQVGGKGASDPILERFAETLKAETLQHTGEIGWQDIIQGYAQDAVSFRLACMKITFDASFIGSPVSANQEDPDIQQNVQRLRVLVEDHARRVFTDSDARFQEMMELKDALQVEGELETWTGIRAENVPLNCIRFDSTIRDIDRISLARWISHDVLMNGDEIRAKYPYKDLGDGKWEGVHPEDMTALTAGRGTDSKIFGDTFWTSQTQTAAGSASQTAPQSEAQTRRFLVREVWNRSDQRVQVLVEGLEYPAASWAPVRTPSQWYPFRFFRFNRMAGTVYGVSDIEMQKDIQNRINSKKSDEEKARWLSLPRRLYDTQGVDNEEVVKMGDVNPGEMRGVNFQGKKPDEVMVDISYEYDPESFNDESDKQDLTRVASLPDEVQGVTSQSRFATGVDAAMQGLAISSNDRMAKFRRNMEGSYHLIAELLCQELSPEEVKLDCGPKAYWPKIFSDAEGKRLYAEIEQQAEGELRAQEQQAAAQAQMAAQQAQMVGGMPPEPPPVPNPDERSSALAAIIEKKCLEVFGFPEPVTREVLFRRLRCRVTVAMNAQADRAAQGQSLMQLFQAIQAGGAAARDAGLVFDPEPLLKMSGNQEAEKMFTRDPAAIGAAFAQLAAGNPGAIPPDLALQLISVLTPIAQAAIAAQSANGEQPTNSNQPAGRGQHPQPVATRSA
jgi:hypothetical protein